MPMTRRMAQRLDAVAADDNAATSASSSESPPATASRRTKKVPKAQRLRSFKRDKQKIDLHCKWLVCTFSTRSMQKFNAHVATHVPVCLDPGNVYERCHWADCEFHGLDEREIRRHVLFHAYHARLMAHAANVISRNELPACTLDASERHVLPTLMFPYVCAWDGCTVEFDDPQGFFWHMEHHIVCHYKDENRSTYAPAKCLWEGCSSSGGTTQRLREHVRIHTEEKFLACPGCGNTFANNQKLADHLKRQLPLEELRYQCSHCLRLYATERLLRGHIRIHINCHRCPHCSMTCNSTMALRVHIKYKHTEQLDYSCPKCQKGFKTLWDHKRHLRLHDMMEKDERHPCPWPGCRYVFLEPVRLAKHYRMIHSGEQRSYYFCHLCDVRYKRVGGMTQHLKTRHNLAVPHGHSRFHYRRGRDGHFRLQTLRYESLELAEQTAAPAAAAAPDPAAAATAAAAAPPPPPGPPVPDVLALSCQEEDVPDTITTDDGRELHLPEQVRRALSTGRRVLVCVMGDQVQLLARMEAMDELRDPDDPDALMMVVDGQAVADGPAAEGHLQGAEQSAEQTAEQGAEQTAEQGAKTER